MGDSKFGETQFLKEEKETMVAVDERVIELVEDAIPGVDRSEIKACEDLFTLGLDSIRVVELIVEIENSWDIEFAMDEVNYEHFRNLTGICNLVTQKVAA